MTDTQQVRRIDASTRHVPRWGGFSWSFLAIELKRTMRNSGTLVFTIAFPIAMLVLIGLPLKNTAVTKTPVAEGGLSVAAIIMVSMAVYGAMVASTMTGVSVASERSMGWSRQLRLTPLNPAVYIGVKVVNGLVVGAIGVLATFIAGTIMGIRAPLGNEILAGIIAWLASLVMTSLGLAVGYAFPAQNAMRYLGPIMPILSFMGGLFVPLSQFPDALQTAAKFTPLWGIADLSQSAIVGRTFDFWAAVSLVVWFAIFTLLAIAMFRRDTKRV